MVIASAVCAVMGDDTHAGTLAAIALALLAPAALQKKEKAPDGND